MSTNPSVSSIWYSRIAALDTTTGCFRRGRAAKLLGSTFRAPSASAFLVANDLPRWAMSRKCVQYIHIYHCVSIYIYTSHICLSIHPSVRPSIHPSIHPSLSLSVVTILNMIQHYLPLPSPKRTMKNMSPGR